MTNAVEEVYSSATEQNPLDRVEDVLSDNNWIYSRMNSDELLVDVAGSVFGYRLCFIWQEHMNALQIVCQLDCAVNDKNVKLAAETLMQINRSMWMGHFELTKTGFAPCFRYTSLLHDRNNESKVYANIQDVVDICLAQCEQYQSVFQILSSDKGLNTQMLSLAMMETVGES